MPYALLPLALDLLSDVDAPKELSLRFYGRPEHNDLRICRSIDVRQGAHA